RQRPRGIPLSSQRLPGPSECKRRHLGGAPALGWSLQGTPLGGKGLHRHIGRLCSIVFHRWRNAFHWRSSARAHFAPFGHWKGTHVSPMGERGFSPLRGLLGQ
ncbi:hypothetical protein N326_05797, partial [Eurypyga helias]